MPSSLIGLLISIVTLMPGFVYYTIRRQLVPTRRLSRTMEVAGFIVVAITSNAIVLILIALIRLLPWIPRVPYSLTQVLRDPAEYLLANDTRLAMVAILTVVIIVGASALSAVFAYRLPPFKYLSEKLGPAITETSRWFRIFESQKPENSSVYVVCELRDGGSVGGRLDWFNTNPEEGTRRDIVLGPPLGVVRSIGNEFVQIPENISRIVVSARDIRYVYVSYVAD